MRVLHLLSNSEWTGPAEPVVNLCRALHERGIDVVVACARGPRGTQSPAIDRASEQGLTTVTLPRLAEHFSVRRNLHDLRLLRRYLATEKFDIVHTHTSNDHLVGALAAGRLRHPPLIIRTSYSADGMTRSIRNGLLLARYTDGLLTRSRLARQSDISSFGLPAERVWNEHFVLGLALEIGTPRHPDAVFEAVARATKQVDKLCVVLIRSATSPGKLVVKPPRELRMDHCAVLPARLYRDDRVAVMNALDAGLVFAFGRDDVFRTLLEAMALAKPCIVPERGVLPEIVTQGTDGLVVRDDPVAMSGALVRLARDRRLCLRLGSNARNRVLRDFSHESQASSIENIYRELIELGRRRKERPADRRGRFGKPRR